MAAVLKAQKQALRKTIGGLLRQLSSSDVELQCKPPNTIPNQLLIHTSLMGSSGNNQPTTFAACLPVIHVNKLLPQHAECGGAYASYR